MVMAGTTDGKIYAYLPGKKIVAIDVVVLIGGINFQKECCVLATSFKATLALIEKPILIHPCLPPLMKLRGGTKRWRRNITGNFPAPDDLSMRHR